MIGRRPTLRVLVSPSLRAGHHPESGHGRLWREGLAELERIADVVETELTARRPRGDVWLADVFEPPPPDGFPVVGYISEAPWADPAATVGLDPSFLELAAALSRRGAARVDRLTVPARTSAAQAVVALRVPDERIDVVPLGVDVAAFGAGDAARGRALVGADYVLFAGQVHARKNLVALRTAVETLAAEGSVRTLVVLASPAVDRPDSAALLDRALAPLAGADLVTLPRPGDPGLADLMAGAAAVCVPSLWEGFGLVAAEAMAAGAPVVVSDRGSLPEVVLDAGVVCAPTAEGVAEGLRVAVADGPGLRAASRARAAELTWGHTAAGWLASLQAAVEGR